jgi:hypothetical protein
MPPITGPIEQIVDPTDQNALIPNSDGSINVKVTANTLGASGATPVTGAVSALGVSGTFTPTYGRVFNVSGWNGGTPFVGDIQLEKTFDGGTTWLPVSVNGFQIMHFTGPFAEQWMEPEVGVEYRLNASATALNGGWASGTLNIRISE